MNDSSQINTSQINTSHCSRFLTAKEAATCANISEETISKYKDLGLLKAFRVNGQEQFREDEIRLVFNSRFRSTSTTAEDTYKTKTSHPADINSSTSQVNTEANASFTNQKSEDDLPTLNDILSEGNSKKDTNTFSYNLKDEAPLSSQIDIQSDVLKNKENQGDFRGFDIPSIELLELTRSLKDQLESVKEERNWLRRRIEKLEASFEREQMITISKTETLRNLVENKTGTRSAWSFLLPWNK